MRSRYVEVDEKIGEGAFGYVVKARDTLTGELVALKKIRLKHYGDERSNINRYKYLTTGSDIMQSNEEYVMPNHILRELKALEQLNHENVVKLKDVFPTEDGGPGLTLVFELCHTDLYKVQKGLYDRQKKMTESQVKGFFQMILMGLAHCHSFGLIHRDLKPPNLLINKHGVLKLADFGLSRVHTKGQNYTNEVGTRWYKAPELLYGSRSYDQAVDLWAVGCIFGELLLRAPLFPGENDIDQLYRIISTCGTPSEANWKGVSQLPDYHKITFSEMKPIDWHKTFPDVAPKAINLLKKFLVYTPTERISANEALLDSYFFTEPLPAHPADLKVLFPDNYSSIPHYPTFDVNAPLEFAV